MRELERRYARELVVIGVHSGKYQAERDPARIRDASLRLGAVHPVVNDRQFRVWRSYAVRAWPTIVVIDPKGLVVGMHAGEFGADQVAPFLDGVIESAGRERTLDPVPRRFEADAPTVEPGRLRYPGKVAVDGRRLAIADSGHHRIVLATLDAGGRRARVERMVGDGEPGLRDGDQPRFDSPQGLAFDGDTLYVADAERHVIRAIDLRSGSARTVAGTGTQLRTREDQRAGALSSPWDLVVADGMLYVAMAGVHQIWRVDPRTGEARVHSGSGREEIVDGPHAEAALAQPMGIASDGARLYFADSETSAIRWSDRAPGGAVGTIVGTGLFDFGDRDGVGDAVRMQHQQGLALHDDGRLLVADSYNDALKWVDPATRTAGRWLDGLREPGGVALAGGLVYVADTNAHRVVVAEVDGAELAPLELEWPRT